MADESASPGSTGEPSALTARVLNETFVERVEHHASLGSTNDRARELALVDDDRAPLLIVADEQTAGRGRGANRWFTGRGALAMSLLFDPARLDLPRELWPRLSLATGVALVDALSPLLPGRLVGLHWPNDIFVGPQKIAGILLEGIPDGRQVAGIGMNVNNRLSEAPAELQVIATSLYDQTAGEYDISDVLVTLLTCMERCYRQLAADPAALGRRFDELCLQHGRILTLDTGAQVIRGVCRGVALDGALILATPEGQRSYYAGALRHDGS